jgi:hypothetical protein
MGFDSPLWLLCLLSCRLLPQDSLIMHRRIRGALGRRAVSARWSKYDQRISRLSFLSAALPRFVCFGSKISKNLVNMKRSSAAAQ